MLPVLNELSPLARQTPTGEQGSEMACHLLLREYFPNGGDRHSFTLDDLRAVEHRINGRPRKRLSWRSPTHAMNAELAG